MWRRPFFWIWLLFFFFSLSPLFAQSVLILYDGVEGKSEAFKSACFLRRLLDHFEIDESCILPVRQYQPGLALSPDFLFLVFEEGHPEFPESLLVDISQRSKSSLWINMHIDRFLEREGDKLGVAYEDWEERADWKIYYCGEDFPKEDPGLNRLMILSPEKIEVLASVVDSQGRTFPYLWKSGNFWYIADSPFSYAYEGGRFLILADILHDFLGQDHPVSHRALIRIEDVNPENDPRSLRRVGRWLESQGIPFAISLIPIFRDPSTQEEIRLSQRPELVAALKELVGRGGTIVLHGATHQHQGRTAEDYEFWDDIVGQPIPHETPDWVEERIRLGLEECLRCGLYPLAWETPHYSASQEDYRIISRFFDSFYDRVMAAELSGTQQIFPYPVFLRDLKVQVIPENLGYVDYENPDPRRLIEDARNLLVVRDGLASFFFHPFVPLKYLQEVIRAMKQMGWNFISLRDFPCNLRTDSLWVTSAGGEGRIHLEGEHLHELHLDRQGRLLKENYSPELKEGIWPQKIVLPPGHLYVLEATSSIPPRTRRFLLGLNEAIRKFLRPGEKSPALRLTKSAVVAIDGLTGEEWNDERSFLSVLRVFGLNPEAMPRKKLSSIRPGWPDLLVVPYPAACRLSRAEVNRVLDYINRGGVVVTDGRSALSERANFLFTGEEIKVKGLKETTLPAPILQWSTPALFQVFSFEEGLVLAREPEKGLPLVVLCPRGKGKILFFGTVFDPLTPFGLSRYPYLAYYLKNSLGLPFSVRRNSIELYFDPGLRPSVSWEKLVRHWRNAGIKIIYLATWHFYENYQFDYRYFIDLCHRFGIAVYAWFELPQVTSLLWERHPEWREKDASGHDARNGWRLPLNLFHPQAREAALSFFRQMLLDYEWDGVNLAELNFDTSGGLLYPARFTPLNDDVREMFREKEGFDPLLFFQPGSAFSPEKNPQAWQRFLDFRRSLVQQLHILFLQEIEKIKKIRGLDWEVIVTALDSILHPEIIEQCGVDTRDIISLMAQFPFILQVEDPARSWTELPSRYQDYLEIYKSLVPDLSRLMFDINVVPWRDIRDTPFPSAQACGTELATMIYFAMQASGRVAIYCEATIFPIDLSLLPFILGADVVIREEGDGYRTSSLRPFNLTLNQPDVQVILNGRAWPLASAAGVSFPSGENRFRLKKAPAFQPQVLAFRFLFDGEVMEISSDGPWYRLIYTSSLPVTFSFTPAPGRLLLDGRPLHFLLDQTSVVLPRGRHKLEIFTETPASHAIRTVGYFSSSLFFLLGSLAVALLAGCYFYIRKKR